MNTLEMDFEEQDNIVLSESLAFFEGGVLLNEKKEKKIAARAAFIAGLSAKKRAKYLAMLNEEDDTDSDSGSDENDNKTGEVAAEEGAPNLLKRIAGAVAGTAKDFVEANKAPKLDK
ncbi:hypothetical protein CYMTET_36672 [Cymbomonas tetramitiformis]|uniref:Uncharacterized protein n=1 Tax=Cymbomonas tetramitiformis TaxID=36881 RepID=A0AAE0CFG0_9CHLO|nr:hypothetical protein CYMTET_43652 [Cymbomonas tetramitiformis]KAK3254101.1 hypothetical protein CYMTET_36672 [Cymbomonas tetramitiformis]